MIQQVTKHNKNICHIVGNIMTRINQPTSGRREEVDPKFSRTCKTSKPETKTWDIKQG